MTTARVPPVFPRGREQALWLTDSAFSRRDSEARFRYIHLVILMYV